MLLVEEATQVTLLCHSSVTLGGVILENFVTYEQMLKSNEISEDLKPLTNNY